EEVAIGTEGWLDLLKVALDADTTLIEGLREERLESRRALAALRFLAQVADFDTEEELTRAAVHASAVWFDVEARIYRRTLSGSSALHTHLPGTHVDETPLALSAAITEAGRVARLPFVELPEDLRWSTGDVVVMPLPPETRPDWLLVLGGTLPASAEAVLG